MMNDLIYKFTVFTPCYNSERFIYRVIESLEQQTFKNFEWLVINDASTDNTKSILENYATRAYFPVRIIHNKQNRMLYYNYNLAFKLAKGELMVFAGHDDKFSPQTLEIFNEIWGKYASSEISGIWCLCQDQNGKLIGKKYPNDFMISNYFSLFEKYIYNKQERFTCTRTDLLRSFEFDLENDRIGETFLWEKLGTQYNTIFINQILRTYYIEPDESTALTKLARSKVAKQTYLSYLDWVNDYLKKYKFSKHFMLRYHLAVVFYGILAGQNIRNIMSRVEHVNIRILLFILFPFAYLLVCILKFLKRL